jgi:hypothetical protein
MPFEIDTGATAEARPHWIIPDWFRDQLPEDADERRAVHDFAYHLIGAMQNPKTFDTVRKHVMANWEFLRTLAEMHPDVFDEFWAAYNERWQAA